MTTDTGTLRFPILVLVAVLAGCATGVQRSDDATKREAYFAKGGKLARDVTISLNDNARARIVDNPGFDRDRLLAIVKQGLDAKGWLAKTPDPSLPTIEIIITDIRVRSGFSAVMFGFLAGNDSITGDVVARDAAGKELQRFSVSASYALGGLGGGQDNTRLGWLYESFATEMIKELGGSEGK